MSKSMLQAWDLASVPKGVVENAGCPECLDAPLRRQSPVLHWMRVAGRSVAELSVEDERESRRRARKAGEPTVLDLALARCAESEHEIGAACALVQSAGTTG